MKNKFSRLLVLSAIGLFGLTACGDVEAKPSDYNKTLVTIKDNGKEASIYNNLLSVVYDQIRDGGSLGSDVLNSILYQYAIGLFGAYNNFITPKPADGEITLAEAYEDIPVALPFTIGDKGKTFIKNHKAYWTVNANGKRINDDDPDNEIEVADDADPCQSEIARLYAKYNSIEDRIAEAMYEKISSGTYSDSRSNIFSEKEFLRSLISSLENVVNPDTLVPTPEMYTGLLTADHEPKEVFGTPDKVAFLHRNLYCGSENVNYIETRVIPDIYRQLLTEQYLLDETYNTLGRSFARKVNIISFKESEDVTKANDYIAHHLLDAINVMPNGTSVEDSTNNIVDLDTFIDYSSAYIGYNLTSEQTDILDSMDTIFTYDGTSYLGTSYGKLRKEYSKIDPNTKLNDSTVEDSYTGSHTYVKEIGLKVNSDKLLLEDNVTTGWFIKNGGLTELPDAIRSRLFNIGVATGLPEYTTVPQELKGKVYSKAELDRWQYKDGVWTKAIPTVNGKEIESAYIARINGKNYLKTSSRVEGASIDEDILHYDSSTKTYYIIQIEEAVSSSKMSKVSTSNYRNIDGNPARMEEIVNEVTKIVSKGSSYSSLATNHYLKAMSLKYHDDKIFEYFKENYPDLFD